MTSRIEGVVPILVTPFHEDGRIDEESLANEVAFGLVVWGLTVLVVRRRRRRQRDA